LSNTPRLTEIRVVEEIEDFPAELNDLVLTNAGALDN